MSGNLRVVIQFMMRHTVAVLGRYGQSRAVAQDRVISVTEDRFIEIVFVNFYQHLVNTRHDNLLSAKRKTVDLALQLPALGLLKYFRGFGRTCHVTECCCR
jgi:hypothetical protein